MFKERIKKTNWKKEEKTEPDRLSAFAGSKKMHFVCVPCGLFRLSTEKHPQVRKMQLAPSEAASLKENREKRNITFYIENHPLLLKI